MSNQNAGIEIDPRLAEAARIGEQAVQQAREQAVGGDSRQPEQSAPAPVVLDLNKRPATIALCMIVKDEEKRLPDSLRSSLPLVDEVVIVDTGSTDKTPDILKQAQKDWVDVLHKDAAKFLILEKAWQGDFSAARNYGIEHATADFILQLDADECVTQNDHLLREAAERAWRGDLQKIGAFFFHLINVLSDGKRTFILHPHLFRRVGLSSGALFKFENTVHNRPIWEGGSIDCPMVIEHYGYGEDEATMLKKHVRRRKMVLDWLEREPDSFWANFYAAQTLSAESGPTTAKDAIAYAKHALDVRPHDSDIPPSSDARCYYSWMICLVREKDADGVIAVAERCIAAIPWYPDPWFFLAWAHLHQGSWQKCCRACLEYFDLQEKAATDPAIQRNFIGVENLTIGAGPTVAGFWRFAARHCQGCAEGDDRKMPELVIAGVKVPTPEPVAGPTQEAAAAVG